MRVLPMQEPPVQAVHSELPAFTAYDFPSSQGMQAKAPAEEEEPAGHTRHCPCDVSSQLTIYPPAAQGTQALHSPGDTPEHPDLYVPAGQLAHAVHVPVDDGVHCATYFPAAQFWQAKQVPAEVPEQPTRYVPG